jgi:hypothetical protein
MDRTLPLDLDLAFTLHHDSANSCAISLDFLDPHELVAKGKTQLLGHLLIPNLGQSIKFPTSRCGQIECLQSLGSLASSALSDSQQKCQPALNTINQREKEDVLSYRQAGFRTTKSKTYKTDNTRLRALAAVMLRMEADQHVCTLASKYSSRIWALITESPLGHDQDYTDASNMYKNIQSTLQKMFPDTTQITGMSAKEITAMDTFFGGCCSV